MSTPSPSTKETLAAREADSKTAADFAVLAQEALGATGLRQVPVRRGYHRPRPGLLHEGRPPPGRLGRGYWNLLADHPKSGAAFAKALPEGSDKPQLLELGGFIAAQVQDPDLAKRFHAKAEEQVTSVGEMNNVDAAVKEHFADAADWVQQVEGKLSRREANQAKYAVFQEREKAAVSTVKTLRLADAVMAELDSSSSDPMRQSGQGARQ